MRKTIPWEFDGITAEIAYHYYQGTLIKTLVINLPRPMPVLSSREGFKQARAICNNYNPPPLWDHVHQYWQRYQDSVLGDLGLTAAETAFLSTGVDIDHFALKGESFAQFEVWAFATAGVGSNAMRVGVDEGPNLERNGIFEPLGTINIIALTNASLSEGAMVRSVITATEAKVVALQDMDIRSCYDRQLQATGTGTDNMVIVSGSGARIHYMGGHAKMGELLAKAVTAATKEALRKHHQGELGG